VTTIAILDYGMGNLRSVHRAVDRMGGSPLVTADPAEVATAKALVVPGVGHFGACMRNLRERGLDRVIREFAATERPLLGVCLGMQVLFDWSEEGAVEGLGLLRGKVRRLPATVTVPHMGWNDVAWRAANPLTAGIPGGSRFYFVHSYVCEADDDLVVGETEHGLRFPAVVASGNVVATQFHPEKSSDAGLALYRNLIRSAA